MFASFKAFAEVTILRCECLQTLSLCSTIMEFAFQSAPAKLCGQHASCKCQVQIKQANFKQMYKQNIKQTNAKKLTLKSTTNKQTNKNKCNKTNQKKTYNYKICVRHASCKCKCKNKQTNKQTNKPGVDHSSKQASISSIL